MSLYNQIFGYNPIAPTLLLILQLDPQKIPRFRDAYIDDLGNIVIYTRTGGNNRATYASENQALREIPGFIRDEDDDYDETFAKFTYEVAEPFVPAVAIMLMAQDHFDPGERWKAMLKGMQEAHETGEPGNDLNVQRAVALGEQLMGQIAEGLESGKQSFILKDHD